MNLNCPIEKSLAAEAEFPYFPRIPIPTCAYCIMPTSLPPSPIARTIPYSFSLTNLTMELFSLGELLQKMTEEMDVRISPYRGLGSVMYFEMLVPSIIKVKF